FREREASMTFQARCPQRATCRHCPFKRQNPPLVRRVLFLVAGERNQRFLRLVNHLMPKPAE
ncbi:hypothetical protein, partial [Brucella intermedia]|uniref:hypothetical protein n=1 Tax=Brucella intermedia TaxID=94625 RepID=UPI001AECDEA3